MQEGFQKNGKASCRNPAYGGRNFTGGNWREFNTVQNRWQLLCEYWGIAMHEIQQREPYGIMLALRPPGGG